MKILILSRTFLILKIRLRSFMKVATVGVLKFLISSHLGKRSFLEV